MNQDKDELLNLIKEALSEGIALDSAEERLFIDQMAYRAATTAFTYMTELLESIRHLRDTVKRLTKE